MRVLYWLIPLKWKLWMGRRGSRPRRARRIPRTLGRYRPDYVAAEVRLLEDRTLLSGMPPVAMADSYQVQFDTLNMSAQSLSSVLANDYDPNSDPLTAVLVSGPSNGSVSLNSNGHFSYTPNDDYSGSGSRPSTQGGMGAVPW